MHSYHVHFTAKAGIPSDEIIGQVHLFMRQQMAENYATAYRLLRLTNKASFQELPDFQLIVDYESESALALAFEGMKMHFTEEPHSSLMQMVSEFRVSFSIDEVHAGQA
jgi:hypothetical protein